jgi:nicotinamide mononucleotide (NMN) deamidase PncC
VGLVFEAAQAVIVALPGPPRELQAMVLSELVPYLSRRFGTRRPGCSLTLRFVGLGQSQIDQTLKEHVPLPPDVMLSSQFEGGRVDFTFSLPGDTPQDHARLEELKKSILKYLGDSVYGDGETSLEQHVVRLLEGRGAKLVLVEAGSGGSLAAGLSAADGTQRVLAGAYVKWTPNTSGAQRAKLLATAAAELTGSQWAIAVGEPQPDEDESGARHVEVVFRLPDGRLETEKARFGGSSPSARWSLTTYLLDQLRRRLK